jgi:hypothetical protein
MMDFLEQVRVSIPDPIHSSLTVAQEKQRLSPHEAISQGSVSAAYVEDFALRVFTSADNEDRSGGTTRLPTDILSLEAPV